jgi:hypothetical protein
MNITPTISVRKLDANHDPIYGNGVADFLTDLDAVAQLIDTSLLLLQGEWWNNLAVGLPLFQQIIGTSGVGNNPQIAALLIQQTILGVPYVNSLSQCDTGLRAIHTKLYLQCHCVHSIWKSSNYVQSRKFSKFTPRVMHGLLCTLYR